MNSATITRRCQSCGARRHVHPSTPRCPDCGAPYGRLTFGYDTDPAEERRFGNAKPEPDSPEVQRLKSRFGITSTRPAPIEET